jgi:sugar phosphate isomerase/epimerase
MHHGGISLKTALHTVSYAGVWPGQVTLPLERIVDKAAELGYDGVMIVAKRPHASPLDMDRDRRPRLRDQIAARGLELAALAGYTDFGAGCDQPGIPFREMQVLAVAELARLARDLGGSLVRIFTAFERPGVSYDRLWADTVMALKECAGRAAEFGVTLAVQNHHDLACHHESLADLIGQVDEPNCRAGFDAWSPALQGVDLAAAARRLAPVTALTIVADYVQRPRFQYDSNLNNYLPRPAAVRAVAPGDGFIDYRAFFAALKAGGYDGWIAYEMCAPLEGGGSEANLDRCARRFVEWLPEVWPGN